MAKVYNITSATFDPDGAAALQAIGFPVNHRVALQGEVVRDSTGKDLFVQANRVAQSFALIQIAFNDHDDLQALQGNSYYGKKGTLVLKVPDTSDVDQTATISDARLAEAIGDAQHADFGSHIVTFEAVASDGVTNPIIWS